ncbi:MAG: hypothetical protein FWC43_05585 [Planctomycetaceae bacterium]|nr:hypothetical protein [Planctomycetaceae bacterium]
MTLTVTSTSPFLMTEGQEMNLFPVSSEVTLSQAARFLKMSEKHLNNLLDIERITFREENGKRMILRNSLLEYERKREKTRICLDEMVRENQELGFYD